MHHFSIDIQEDEILDLRQRVLRTRWPEETGGDGWRRGVPVAYLQPIAEYWARQFEWRPWEARLNRLGQCITTIDGQRIHFLHVRSRESGAMPIILTHGWPGSVLEFVDILGPLTDPAGHNGHRVDAFHVVIPSVPGFGYSIPLSETGWTHARIARAWAELMRRLDYHRYGAQGGDTGFLVSPKLGPIAPESVAGVHVNGGLEPPPPALNPADLSPDENRRLEATRSLFLDGGGYAEIQGTRPKTLAFALTNSPVALLAWILDKVHDWTDPAHDLPELAIPLDHLLANVSLYWFTKTASTSAHLYYETRHAPADFYRWPVTMGVAAFPTDSMLRSEMERRFNIVRWTEFRRGGHFAAMEAPDLLVEEMREFFRPLR